MAALERKRQPWEPEGARERVERHGSRSVIDRSKIKRKSIDTQC
jgi:hypothetical protein